MEIKRELTADVVGTRARQGRGLIKIVWLYVCIVVLLLLMSSLSIGLIAAGRAYVAGEGMWSKAQKQAVQALQRYVTQQELQDYERYEQALAVMLGDRRARIELEKADPDLRIATQGFLQGRNHPDDVPGMIRLFRTFRRVPDIDRAISIWAEADVRMEQLVALATRIQAHVNLKQADPHAVQSFLHELHALDDDMTVLEDAFSSTLGEAARKTELALLVLLFFMAGILLVVSYEFSRRLLRQNTAFQHTLLDSENQLRNLLESAPQPILIVRAEDGAMVYTNHRARAQFRLPSDLPDYPHAQDFFVRPQERDQLLATLRQQGSVADHEVELQDSTGHPFWALVSARRMNFAGHDSALTTIHDINERKREEQALQHRAFHDELTGLPNRAMFMEELNRAKFRTDRFEGMFSLLFVDLDAFKQVNDTYGHRIGDLLLREVATRLRVSLRESDLVARLGGDEFVILLESKQGDQSEEAALVAQKVLSALTPVCILDGLQLHITASIGISRYPHDGTELGELLRRADAAMYTAKEQGNRYTFASTAA
jgi:diguanylate cyclase (GGDEF)-like protein/PAS domain S-box-containing protein